MHGNRTQTIVALAVLAALAAAALAGSAALFSARAPTRAEAAGAVTRPGFAEVKWPFPIDQWGSGKAFRCGPPDCGAEVILYLRAKIGFCNCTTGVADDEELERVGDVTLIDGNHAAAALGQPISVAWMKGRKRSYSTTNALRAKRSLLAIAVNDRCDVVVATAIVDSRDPASAEGAVLEFMSSDAILRWVEITLGL